MRIKDKRCFYVALNASLLSIAIIDPVNNSFKIHDGTAENEVVAVPVGMLVSDQSGFASKVRINGVEQTRATDIVLYGQSGGTLGVFSAYGGLKAGDVIEFATS